MGKGRDMSALMTGKAATKGTKTTKTIKTTKTTIMLDDADLLEMDRIADVLRAEGIKLKADTQILRVALRAAFQSLEGADLVAVCGELSEKWKRGSK